MMSQGSSKRQHDPCSWVGGACLSSRDSWWSVVVYVDVMMFADRYSVVEHRCDDVRRSVVGHPSDWGVWVRRFFADGFWSFEIWKVDFLLIWEADFNLMAERSCMSGEMNGERSVKKREEYDYGYFCTYGWLFHRCRCRAWWATIFGGAPETLMVIARPGHCRRVLGDVRGRRRRNWLAQPMW